MIRFAFQKDYSSYSSKNRGRMPGQILELNQQLLPIVVRTDVSLDQGNDDGVADDNGGDREKKMSFKDICELRCAGFGDELEMAEREKS